MLQLCRHVLECIQFCVLCFCPHPILLVLTRHRPLQNIQFPHKLLVLLPIRLLLASLSNLLSILKVDIVLFFRYFNHVGLLLSSTNLLCFHILLLEIQLDQLFPFTVKLFP